MRKEYALECKECKVDSETKKLLCTYCITQKVFKGKWKLLIYWHLQQGTKRFNELCRLIPATQTTVARQLKELEEDGIINRKVYNQIPPKVEYSIAPLGKKFYGIMEDMHEFGVEFFKANNIPS
jgi:DNA-binding HxlR family transcriptional regulator